MTMCFLNANYYKVLIGILSRSPEIAGCIGTIKDTITEASFLKSFFHMPHHGDGRLFSNGIPTFPHGHPGESYTEFLSGGMSVYSSEILREYRFDDRLGGTKCGYGDDVDVSFRVSRKHKLFYTSNAVLMADEEAPGRGPGVVQRWQWIQNMFYLLRKNSGFSVRALFTFSLMTAGFMIDDFRKKRKGAFFRNWLAVKTLFIGNLDSIKPKQV
jgi:hypothetical protein